MTKKLFQFRYQDIASTPNRHFNQADQIMFGLSQIDMEVSLDGSIHWDIMKPILNSDGSEISFRI